jgi:hypothetical protein
MNQLACRRQDQRRRRKLGNLHGTAILALSVNRRNQAPIDRELEAPGASARQRVPNGHSVRDTCSQRP